MECSGTDIYGHKIGGGFVSLKNQCTAKRLDEEQRARVGISFAGLFVRYMKAQGEKASCEREKSLFSNWISPVEVPPRQYGRGKSGSWRD